MDLNDLTVSINGLEIAEIEDLARRLYREIYVTSGRYGVFEAHDGESVYFWEDRFEHAFYTSSNRIRYPDRKDRLDLERVKRMRWIKEIIRGEYLGRHAGWRQAQVEVEDRLTGCMFFYRIPM